MAGLNPGGRRPAGDDGTADPRLTAVLDRYGAGQESEPAMLTALARARLLVPLVERPAAANAADPCATEPCATDPRATGHDGCGHEGDAGDHQHGDDGCDRRMAREMTFPTLIGRDGRPALLAFTSLVALLSWRADARPVPTPAEQVWGSAVDGQSAVVIDVAGPVPVAVDGTRLAALARGEPPPEPHTDPDIRADVAAALAATPARPGHPVIVGADLAAGPDGTDLAVRLLLQPPVPGPLAQQPAQEAVQQAAQAIVARLAGRLRRGIQFSAATAPAPTPAPAGRARR